MPHQPGPVSLPTQPSGHQRTLHLSLPQDNALADQSSHNEHGRTPLDIGQRTAPQGTRDGGAFIDRALRERVDSDIAAFLTAFDAALAGDTADSRAGLREATDRLLRAGARTRIELERLEARVPLPPRDNGPSASRES